MSELLDRAEALREILAARIPAEETQAIANALVDCASALVNAGEDRVALDLLDGAASLESSANTDWQVRYHLVRCRALMDDAQHDAALALVREKQVEFADELQARDAEASAYKVVEGTLLWRLNRVEEAVALLSEERARLLTKPDSLSLAWCAYTLSSAEYVRGEYAAARRYVLESLVSARRSGSEWVEAAAQGTIGRLERQMCRWPAAEEAARESLVLYEQCGYRKQANTARRSIAITCWKRGKLEEGLEAARQCRQEAEALGDEWLGVYAGLLEGLLLADSGEYQQAHRIYLKYVDTYASIPQSRASLLTTEFLGDIHLEQGQPDEASRYYEEVWPKAMALVPKGDIVAELRRRRAEVHFLKGNHTAAYDEAKRGLQHCRDLGDRYEEAATYRVLALSAAAVGRADEARRWFDQGFAYYDDIETPFEWGKLWLAYGDWLRGPHAGGFADDQGALEAYHAARDHFARMGASAKLDDANKRIADTMTRKPSAPAIRESTQLELEEDKPKHARRRPRRSSELDTRSDWARESFGLITRHPQMLHILEDVEKLAGSTSPILVLGESGTGKELIANGIHKLSSRTGAYVPINCSALPREIIESELFGHVAGSFTGATRDKAGLFEVCDSGTVFLDEIATMSLELQSRLLRFLESGESRRIGSNKNIAVSTRIVAATNGERASLEKGDGFRPDLYYRLAHAVVTLPPLRRRGDDVDLLIDHFLEQTCREEGKRVRLSGIAWKRLREHPWPGNIRQLRAAIKRVVLLATPGREVGEAELQLDGGSAPANLLEELEQTEREKIARALTEARGSRTEAARSLGIPRTTFLNKMKRYGLR